MEKQKIDFEKVIQGDDIDEALDTVRGLIPILMGLDAVRDMGTHDYDKYIGVALIPTLSSMIDDFEAMIPKVDYMLDRLRG